MSTAKVVEALRQKLLNEPGTKLLITDHDGAQRTAEVEANTAAIRKVIANAAKVRPVPPEDVIIEDTPSYTKDPHALLYEREAQYERREREKAEEKLTEAERKKASWKKKARKLEAELRELRHQQELAASAAPKGLSGIITNDRFDKILEQLAPGMQKLGLGIASRVVDGPSPLGEQQTMALKAMKEWFAVQDEPTQQHWWDLFIAIKQSPHPANVIADIFHYWQNNALRKTETENHTQDGIPNGTHD